MQAPFRDAANDCRPYRALKRRAKINRRITRSRRPTIKVPPKSVAARQGGFWIAIQVDPKTGGRVGAAPDSARLTRLRSALNKQEVKYATRVLFFVCLFIL